MVIHLYFDILSYIIAGLLLRFLIKPKLNLDSEQKHWYYSVLIIGFVLGAVVIGSINTYLSMHKIIFSKSIMGAIFGGIVAIEVYKKIAKIKGSTGAYFVPSLALGIAIGRIGCYKAGLPDFTYGIETTLPWGVDFGDGIKRHPVQLYESFAMFAFFIYAMFRYYKNRDYFEKFIFYEFVLFYATQRFAWEFLKPYEKIAFDLNIFQIVGIMMIVYAIKKRFVYEKL